MNDNKTCIYTCLFGGYETLNEFPGHLGSQIPRICFTDDPHLKSDTWAIRVVQPAFPMDSVRSQRRVKILAHEYLPEFDASVYVDNTVALKAAPEALLQRFLSDSDIAVPVHSYRDSILDEFVAVAKEGLDEPSRIFEQLNHYQFTYDGVLAERPYWTAILLRYHCRPSVRRAMETWHNHVMRYSRRDQLSFNVALAENRPSVRLIEVDNHKSDFHQWPISRDRDTTKRHMSFAMSGAPAVAQLRLSQQDLARATSELSSRAAQVLDAQTELTSLRSAVAARDAQIATLEQRLEESQEQISVLGARAHEVADLRSLHQQKMREALRILGEEAAKRSTLEARLATLTQAAETALSLRPVRTIDRIRAKADPRRKNKIALITSSSLFDAHWYLQAYPDVAASGMNPAEHYLFHGGLEGRNPGPHFNTALYLGLNRDVAASGMNALLHYESYGRAEKRRINLDNVSAPPASSEAIAALEISEKLPTVDDILRQRFPYLRPLPIYRIPSGGPRITIVTDSINAGSLFGGVGTALIFGALLARHLNARLRIATRAEPAESSNFASVMKLNAIPWDGNVEFEHIPRDGSVPLGICDNDHFITTSWWTTYEVREVVKPERIVYLLQEDERMFYAAGDERLRCAQVLQDPNLRYVINTELLYRHLVAGPEPLRNIERNAVWFEPAFPSIRPAQREQTGRRRQFFFYARPHNLRNLYFLGLEVLRECLTEGVLSSDEWDIHFVGKDLTKFELPGGVVPRLHQNMPWGDYVRLIQKMDVGLSLMDTPHPSYPPIDLATAGAVVVTNTHGSKTTLDKYSPNIICAEPTVEALKFAISRAIARSADPHARSQNVAAPVNRDWQTAFTPVLRSIFGEARGV